ncbi:MAG: M48 family metallopeptidase [Candidatus Pacebacteria bacterium]|nr:M48 family metallopeptidase [Candidatus Paceibacterota bacterium]
MATLYTHAESNIRKTFLLMTFFLIFVILIGWILSYALDNYFILVIAVVFSIVQSFISYWYSDKIILKTTRAIPVTKENEKEIYRIVENLCITAGLPVPKIYIIEEAQPNAFATGRDKDHAVIVVTRGLLEKLERSEIEGVIAHELSHVGNKDMLLQAVVVILVGVIALLSNLFLRISFFGGGRRNNDSGEFGLILMALGLIAAILAPIAATLIQLSISRKREFLADSTGALLTRYPEGLASALEKISEDETPLRGASNSNAHLFIANPFRGKQKKSWISKLFMTHPPIGERIKALRDMKVE